MRINLKAIISNRIIEKKVLADILFPKSKYPLLALNRLIFKNRKLNECQLYQLSTHTGIAIEALYEPAKFWKASKDITTVRFTNGEYTALYDHETGITKILLLDKKIAVHTISPKTQTLTEYLSQINQIINKSKIQTS